jgi:hypothetical protein
LCVGTIEAPRSSVAAVDQHLHTPAALVALDDAAWLREAIPSGDWLAGFDGMVFVADARAPQGGPWDAGPWFGAAAARYRRDSGGFFEHRTPDEPSERERLWDRYAQWLGVHGLEPVGLRKQAPWNQVIWQTFRSDDLAVELQIRRPGHGRSWMVYLRRRPILSSRDALLP